MPAYCTTASTFDIYVKWCVEHHRTPPTRAWWDHAISQPRQAGLRQADTQFDADTERREGWAL